MPNDHGSDTLGLPERDVESIRVRISSHARDPDAVGALRALELASR